MSFFSKLIKKKYYQKDNVGTFYTTVSLANAAWASQGVAFQKGANVDATFFTNEGSIQKNIDPKGYPYLCFEFDSEKAAKNTISNLSFVEVAKDTGNMITLKVMEVCCFETEQKGLWELILWGDELDTTLYSEAEEKFINGGGKHKGSRKPEKSTAKIINPKKKGNLLKDVKFKSKDYSGSNTYEVYSAPSKDAALEFLKTKPVTKGLYYIVVETPEGNWGKDLNGTYKE